MKKGWSGGGAAVLALLAMACASAPRTSFYALQPPASVAAAATPLPAQLGVAEPRATHLLRQDRIVYFTGGNQLNFYSNHRWSEPPAYMVQGMLIRQVRRAGLFENVVAYRAQKGLDYVLRGRLLAMEEVDDGPEVSVRFGLELELVRQEDNAVVWTGQESCTRGVAPKAKYRTVDEVVEAMSGCAQESLDRLTAAMGSALASLPPVRGTAKAGSAK
jgi:ABC-type uncharacterized transport system auxiliary subunit